MNTKVIGSQKAISSTNFFLIRKLKNALRSEDLPRTGKMRALIRALSSKLKMFSKSAAWPLTSLSQFSPLCDNNNSNYLLQHGAV